MIDAITSEAALFSSAGSELLISFASALLARGLFGILELHEHAQIFRVVGQRDEVIGRSLS